MKPCYIPFALALTGFAVATPKSLLHPEVLSNCEAAPNCETYDTSQGLMIRFKANMEPGSDDWNSRFPNATEHRVLIKRNTQTHVTFGSTSISYGTTNPCDALHHCLYDYCKHLQVPGKDFRLTKKVTKDLVIRRLVLLIHKTSFDKVPAQAHATAR